MPIGLYDLRVRSTAVELAVLAMDGRIVASSSVEGTNIIPHRPPDQALLRLGRVYRSLGNEAEARRVWERIGRDYPQSAGAAEAGQLLVTP